MYPTTSGVARLSATGDALPGFGGRNVARILLADTDVSSRLTLKSILRTVGYAVECAASAGEAIDHLNQGEYQLVLADLGAESEEAGAQQLAYARQKEFRPATALLSSNLTQSGEHYGPDEPARLVHMSNEDISHLLSGVAELISYRRVRANMRRVA